MPNIQKVSKQARQTLYTKAAMMNMGTGQIAHRDNSPQGPSSLMHGKLKLNTLLKVDLYTITPPSGCLARKYSADNNLHEKNYKH